MDDKEKARLVGELDREGLLVELQLELTWKRLLAVWWLVFWRYCLGVLTIFNVIDFIWRKFIAGEFVLAMSSSEGAAILFLLIGILLAVIWGVAVIYMALTKHYKLNGFRLMLLAR